MKYLERNLSANMRQKIRRLLRQNREIRRVPDRHAEKDTFERDLEISASILDRAWGRRKRSAPERHTR